jgi:hypothetical protein
MSDHEQLADDLSADADRLETENERVGQEIEGAREARDSAAADDFIAHERPQADSTASGDQPIGDLTDVGDSQGDEGPPPEASYTSKE